LEAFAVAGEYKDVHPTKKGQISGPLPKVDEKKFEEANKVYSRK